MICCNCLEKISHRVKKCPKCGAPVKLFVGGVSDVAFDEFRLRYEETVVGRYNTAHYSGVLKDLLQREWITPFGDFSGVYRKHKITTPEAGVFNYTVQQANSALIYKGNCVVSTMEANGKYQVKIISLANQWGEVNNDFLEFDFKPEPGAIIFGDFYILPVRVGSGSSAVRKIALINLKTLVFCGFLQDSNADITFGGGRIEMKLPRLLYDTENRLLYVCAEKVMYVYIYTNSQYTPFKLFDRRTYLNGSAKFCEVIADKQSIYLLLYREDRRSYSIVQANAVNTEKGLIFNMDTMPMFTGKSIMKIFMDGNKLSFISLHNNIENAEDGNLYLHTIDMTVAPNVITGMRGIKQTVLIQNFSLFNCIDLIEINSNKLIVYGHFEGYENNIRKVVFAVGDSAYTLLSNMPININDLPFFNVVSRSGTKSEYVPCPKHLSTNTISVYSNGRNLCLS